MAALSPDPSTRPRQKRKDSLSGTEPASDDPRESGGRQVGRRLSVRIVEERPRRRLSLRLIETTARTRHMELFRKCLSLFGKDLAYNRLIDKVHIAFASIYMQRAKLEARHYPYYFFPAMLLAWGMVDDFDVGERVIVNAAVRIFRGPAVLAAHRAAIRAAANDINWTSHTTWLREMKYSFLRHVAYHLYVDNEELNQHLLYMRQVGKPMQVFLARHRTKETDRHLVDLYRPTPISWTEETVTHMDIGSPPSTLMTTPCDDTEFANVSAVCT